MKVCRGNEANKDGYDWQRSPAFDQVDQVDQVGQVDQVDQVDQVAGYSCSKDWISCTLCSSGLQW